MSKILKIEVVFDIGDLVYLVTDSDQSKYHVMAYYLTPTGTFYEVYSHDYGNSYVAYDFELSRIKSIV